VDIARKVVVEEDTIVVVRTYELTCGEACMLGMARAVGMSNGIKGIKLTQGEMRLKGMADRAKYTGVSHRNDSLETPKVLAFILYKLWGNV
jgi:hypothetical protein